MRQSVSACFCFEDQIFVIERQNHLSVFPGYLAFPGGKVDRIDSEKLVNLNSQYPQNQMSALVREMREELGLDLESLQKSGEIKSIDYLGVAITPDFNPYRFENFYYRIELKSRLAIVAEEDEAACSYWISCKELLTRYQNCEVLAVPPMVTMLQTLGLDLYSKEEIDLNLHYNPHTEVPMIESLAGVKQFLPLSNTFPPANRTNCFLIGDENSTPTLIDPSPKDESEYQKLNQSLKKFKIDQIFITHHHPDHHELAPRMARERKLPMLMSSYTHQRLIQKYGEAYLEGVEVKFVQEGDVICQSRSLDVKVYEVPGHDEGQLALAPTDLHWFLVGDLIQTVGTVVIGHPEGDMHKYFATLKRVIDLCPRFIIPSHGISIGGTHKLGMTLKHREQRELQILKLYQEGKSPEDILEVVYEGIEAALRKYALKTIDAHLRKLNFEGKISYEGQF